MNICSRCGSLLIFRNYRGNDHQPLHIPSGWHCWSLGRQDGALPAEPLPFPNGGERSETYWEPLKKRALQLYRDYRTTHRMKPLLDLVGGEIEAGNDVMVESVLEEILERFPSAPERNSFLRQVVESDGWQAIRDRATA